MKDKEYKEFMKLYENWDTEELLKAIAEDFQNYREDVLPLMEKVLLKRGVDIPPRNEPVIAEIDWNINLVKKTRYIYLFLFLILIIGNIVGTLFHGGLGTLLINNITAILFLPMFIFAERKVLKSSVVSLVLSTLVILFIPYLSILTIMSIDRQIYDKIKKEIGGK